MKKITTTYDWVFTAIMLVATTGFLVYGLVTGDQVNIFDSALLLISSGLTIGFFKILRIPLAPSVHLTVQIFIFLALFVGKIINIYQFFPWWDTFLHAISGGMLGLAGVAILALLVPKPILQKLSPLFVALFVIFFGIAMAGIWEIFEFLGDTLFGLQSQGNSLWDTMIDLTMGTAGSVIVAWFVYKYQQQGKYQMIGDVLAIYLDKTESNS
ncbi:MAG: hypothetical protein ACRC5Q_05845 [Culicoidibacterales bacterium]